MAVESWTSHRGRPVQAHRSFWWITRWV